MRSFRTVVAALAATGFASTALIAAPAQADWIGTWGYVTAPLPPGPATPAPAPAASSTVVPLGPIPAPPAPAGPRPAPPAPLLENPGGVPVEAGPADLGNVTVRQLVRVSMGGKQLRLRLSNEGGADAMTLGVVHVGEAGPDGAVIPGTDRVVTFDGRPGVTAPAGSPVLSDPIDLPTKALDRLYISVYAPGGDPGTPPAGASTNTSRASAATKPRPLNCPRSG